MGYAKYMSEKKSQCSCKPTKHVGVLLLQLQSDLGLKENVQMCLHLRHVI